MTSLRERLVEQYDLVSHTCSNADCDALVLALIDDVVALRGALSKFTEMDADLYPAHGDTPHIIHLHPKDGDKLALAAIEASNTRLKSIGVQTEGY